MTARTNIIVYNLFSLSQYIIYTYVRVILLKLRLNHAVILFS